MARKTIEELLAEEAKKSEQSKVRTAELKARQRGEDRKRDAHRKIVAGATLLVRVKLNPRLRRAVQEDFSTAGLHPKHRAVIPDLVDERAFQEAVRAAANKAAIEAKEEAAATASTFAKTSAVAPGAMADRSVDGTQIQPAPPMRPVKAPGEPPSGAAPS